MENKFLANSSVLDISKNCTDCHISAAHHAVAECVFRILDSGIDKLCTALLIPSLMADTEFLKLHLGKTQLQKCITYYNKYMKHAKLMQNTEEKQLNIVLIELIDIFCENRSIRNMQIDENLFTIHNTPKVLLNALKQLRNIAEVTLKTTAVAQMKREKTIHRFCQDNENIVKSLSQQRKLLHDQEINLRWKLTAKQALIKKYEEDLAAIKWENNLKIKQEILKSSSKIRDVHTKSLLRQDSLFKESDQAKLLYSKCLKSNLKNEKDMRDKKNKLMLQLQELIKKYDQNIGDKIQENLKLQNDYDRQQEKLVQFFVEYNRQEKEYNELAQMKLNEETAEFERKLMLFMTTRAARTVQRHYRKYLKTKKKVSKGRGKGKKNKKK